MPLAYLKSDYIKPVSEIQEPGRNQKRVSRGYIVKLSFLMVAFVITCCFSYNLWVPKVVAKTTDVQKGLTAIIHDAPKPSAIIDGKILYVGDSIGKSTVVDIQAGCVTLKRSGKTYQMSLR